MNNETKNDLNKENAKQITKVIKYGSKIMGYEIENGHQIGKAAAIEMAKNSKELLLEFLLRVTNI